MKYLLPQTLLALALTTACAKAEKDDVSSDYASNTVEVTDENGVVTGQFKKDATTDQTMVGSSSSANGESFITLPPGAIAIDTAISMQDGANLGANNDGNLLPSQLEMADTAIVGGSSPLVLASSTVVETSQPFSLNIPIPLSSTSSTTNSLFLADGTSKIAILYLVKTSAGNKVGLFVLGQDDLVGTIVKYQGAKFGWFRVVVLSKAVATVEKSTQQEPPKASDVK